MASQITKASLDSINEDVLHLIVEALSLTTFRNEDSKLITGRKSIKMLSSVNRHMRLVLQPIVFRSISIDVRSWHIALQALKLVESSQVIGECMRSFHLRIYDYARGSFECVDGIPEAFASVLNRTPKLDKLSVAVPDYESRSYEVALHSAEVYLPSVRSLVLSPELPWMLDFCPGTNKVSTCKDWPMRRTRPDQHSLDFVQALARARGVQTFEMEENWNADLVQRVHAAMPDLECLAIQGWNQYFQLRDLLKPLKCFQVLKTLYLPMASELGIGFHPPDCGNAYMGPNGDEVTKRVEEEQRQAEHRALAMICTACPQLEVLWVANRKMLRPSLEVLAELSKTAFPARPHPLFD